MRAKIIEAILAGQTLRQITSWADPPVSTASVCRFKQSATAKTAASFQEIKNAIALKGVQLNGTVDESVSRAVLQAQLASAVDPFLTRVAYLDADRARVKGLAESTSNLSTWAALDRNDLSALELHARLAGRLDAPSQGSSTTFVLMPLMQVQAPPVPNADAVDVAFTSEPATPKPGVG